jgi:hypothetical protein
MNENTQIKVALKDTHTHTHTHTHTYIHTHIHTYIYTYIGKRCVQQEDDSLYQQIGLKFEEKISKMLHLEHGFEWY